MLPAVTGGRGRKEKSHDATFLSDLGIKRDQSSRFQRIAQVPNDRSHSATRRGPPGSGGRRGDRRRRGRDRERRRGDHSTGGPVTACYRWSHLRGRRRRRWRGGAHPFLCIRGPVLGFRRKPVYGGGMLPIGSFPLSAFCRCGNCYHGSGRHLPRFEQPTVVIATTVQTTNRVIQRHGSGRLSVRIFRTVRRVNRTRCAYGST
jgi:hypothetical protein